MKNNIEKKGLQARNQLVADHIIEILQDAGFSPDEMVTVIRMARERFIQIKTNGGECTAEKTTTT